MLLRDAGKVLSAKRIAGELVRLGYRPSPADAVVRLRADLGEAAAAHIVTVRKRGYLFAVDLLGAQIALAVGEYRLEPPRAVFVSGIRVRVSNMEYAVLHALLENAGETIPRQQLAARVYGPRADEFNPRTVNVYVYRLRAKIMAVDPAAWRVVPIEGVGYRFDL